VLLGYSDVSVQLADWREGVTSDLFNFCFDSYADVLFNLTQLLRCCPLSFEDHVSADFNRITGFTDIVDFLLGSVGNAGVGHRVAVVSVCVEFDEKGAVLLYKFARPFNGLSHRKHILSLDANAGDLVTSCVKLSVVGSSCLAGAHAIVIVFTNKNHRQRPKSSHVCGLSKLALVGSTITIKSASEVWLFSVLHCECQSSTDGDLGTHDSVASEVVIFCVVVMHRATFSL